MQHGGLTQQQPVESSGSLVKTDFWTLSYVMVNLNCQLGLPRKREPQIGSAYIRWGYRHACWDFLKYSFKF